MATDRQIFDLIRASLGYRVTVGVVDKTKVQKALDGQPSQKPRSVLAEAAWHLARRITVQPPPTPVPPDPTYIKVAPRVCFKAGNSDARFCTVNQPGVVVDENGHARDDSGATYDPNGLCKNGVRSDGPAATSALEIDGRDLCSLPLVGDAKSNTGSWAI